MAASYAVPLGTEPAVPAGRPGPALLAAIAAAGLLAAGCSLALGLTNEDVTGIQVLLLEWISVPYIVAGLIAWWRRPDSRLGVLMIAAGFATALSALAFAQYAAPHTVGLIFDVLPAVIFLHVYLAYPSGRLRSRFEQGLVAAGYVAAIGLQLVKMLIGGVGSHNLLEVSSRPDAAHTVEQIQLLSIAALKLLADSAEGVGYLLKDRISDVDEFVAAVRRVADGGSALDPIIVSTLLSRQRPNDPLATLTPRELEVLELMAAGSSNQGIADKLVITLRAVEKYVSSIFGKLGLPSSGSESRRVLAVLMFLRS